MCYNTIISHKFSILSLNKMSPRFHNTSPEKQNYLYHFHRSLSIVIVNEARDVNTARANHHRFNRQSTAPSPQHTTYLFLWSTKGAQNDQRVPTEEGQKNTLLSTEWSFRPMIPSHTLGAGRAGVGYKVKLPYQTKKNMEMWKKGINGM